MHRASATDAVFSGGFPLTSEDCEDHVVDPFVLEPQALHEMSLVSHAEPLEQPDRCQIARVHRSEDAMFAELDAIKTGQTKITSNEQTDLKVRVYGDVAVVTGKSDVKGMISGTEVNGPFGFTRVCVKKGGRWQSVAFQQTRVSNP